VVAAPVGAEDDAGGAFRTTSTSRKRLPATEAVVEHRRLLSLSRQLREHVLVSARDAVKSAPQVAQSFLLAAALAFSRFFESAWRLHFIEQ
jgi:hypothetical protein